MLRLKIDNLKTQLVIIILLSLLLPSAAMLYDIFYAAKADDVLVAEMEKKLTQITNLVSQRVYDQMERQGEEYNAAILEEVFNSVAEPLSEKTYPGVRICLYINDTQKIIIHGYLHEFAERLPEEKQERERRIFNETKAGIAAVQTSGNPITRLGKTWDDQFLEHLVPVKINNQAVAVLWAEERMHPIFAQSQQMRLALRYVIFGVFGIGVLASLLTIFGLFNHMRTIKHGLTAMEKDLNNLLPKIPGEMGQITEAINDMARVLMEKNQLIEHYKRQEDLIAMGRLVTEIAHELRAPVSIIQATAQAIETEMREDAPMEEYMQRIEEQVERHSKLINELLTFGRLGPEEMQTTDINELIDNVVDSIKPLLPKNKIKLNYLPSQTPTYIDANADKLKQVFINLILNALEAMQQKGILTIQTFIEDEYAVMKVSDTGTGITQEELQNIFKPFFTRKSGGSGLGLAISQRIIQIHGGSIAVESKAEHGTIFTVRLPLQREIVTSQDK